MKSAARILFHTRRLALAAAFFPAGALVIASSETATGARSEIGSLALSAAISFSGSPVGCPPEAVGANEC